MSVVACRAYDEAVPAALERLLEQLGGWDRFLRPGLRVLVKPNLLTDRPPEDAATTHPVVLTAVLRRLKAAGCRVSVGDSPVSAVQLAAVWERTGVGRVCREEGVPLLRFEGRPTCEVRADGHCFHIASEVLEADLLVSLPKVKTHTFTTLTAAVKNLYGTLPGYQKARLHKETPHPDAFGRMLRALLSAMPSTLHIADAVVGMEGDGPSNGKPVQLGFLAASTDAVALDIALCQALRIPLRRVPYLDDHASCAAAIEWRGPSLAALAIPDVDVPGVSRLHTVPLWLVRLCGRWIWVRPSINDACVACGRCVKACPVAALSLRGRDRPLLDPRRCIGCCCCHETCPVHAIDMRQSAPLRWFGTFAGL